MASRRPVPVMTLDSNDVDVQTWAVLGSRTATRTPMNKPPDSITIFRICTRQTNSVYARRAAGRYHRLTAAPRPHVYTTPRSINIFRSNNLNSKPAWDRQLPSRNSSPALLRFTTSSSPSSSCPNQKRQRTMPPASDEDYAAFLEKADNDASGSASASSAGGKKKKQFTTNSVDAEVPSVLSKVDRDYTSESDERFEVVSLEFEEAGGSVGVGNFKKVSGHGDVEALDLKAFDPKGEYKDVVDAVKEAGNGKAEVFRVGLDGARCEYWVVSVDTKGKKIVGLRAGAVES